MSFMWIILLTKTSNGLNAWWTVAVLLTKTEVLTVASGFHDVAFQSNVRYAMRNVVGIVSAYANVRIILHKTSHLQVICKSPRSHLGSHSYMSYLSSW